jgi:arginine-tRNA-protein transferase
MARLLGRFTGDQEECSYLPDRPSSLEVQVLLDVTPAELDALLVRGWRRFGVHYLRPACAGCRECVSIRVPVERFEPDRSQRRARKSCADLRAVVGRPSVDGERLDLYRRWHASREAKRGWNPSAMDAESYELEFAFPHPSGREIAYYEGDRLVGIALCDATPSCWSACYFYYDPALARRSIGTANVLFQIEHARSLGTPHLYLGFRVLGCPSMRYKAAFRPHELLEGRPGPGEAPRWVEAP